MKTSISAPDPETGMVSLTFREGRIVHKREVRAVFDADGNYDRDATKDIVSQLERGVAEKIRLGLIS